MDAHLECTGNVWVCKGRGKRKKRRGSLSPLLACDSMHLPAWLHTSHRGLVEAGFLAQSFQWKIPLTGVCLRCQWCSKRQFQGTTEFSVKEICLVYVLILVTLDCELLEGICNPQKWNLLEAEQMFTRWTFKKNYFNYFLIFLVVVWKFTEWKEWCLHPSRGPSTKKSGNLM